MPCTGVGRATRRVAPPGAIRRGVIVKRTMLARHRHPRRLGRWRVRVLVESGAGDVSVDLVEAFQRRGEAVDAGRHRRVCDGCRKPISGVTRPAIYMHPTEPGDLSRPSRFPPGGHFRAWFALKEEAWDKGPTASVSRRHLVGRRVRGARQAGRSTPYDNPADRGWLPIDLDLAKWAGKQVDLDLQHHVRACPAISPTTCTTSRSSASRRLSSSTPS